MNLIFLIYLVVGLIETINYHLRAEEKVLDVGDYILFLIQVMTIPLYRFFKILQALKYLNPFMYLNMLIDYRIKKAKEQRAYEQSLGYTSRAGGRVTQVKVKKLERQDPKPYVIDESEIQ